MDLDKCNEELKRDLDKYNKELKQKLSRKDISFGKKVWAVTKLVLWVIAIGAAEVVVFFAALLSVIVESGSSSKNTAPKRRFKYGELVLVKWRGQEGYIIDINKDTYTVSLMDGRRVEICHEKDLEKVKL